MATVKLERSAKCPSHVLSQLPEMDLRVDLIPEETMLGWLEKGQLFYVKETGQNDNARRMTSSLRTMEHVMCRGRLPALLL